MNYINKKRKQRITALTLAATLLLSGCNNSFETFENENGVLTAADDSYIYYSWLQLYYVLEVYNNVTRENEIYIVREDIGGYVDVFTNMRIYVDTDDSIFNYVKETHLEDYIISFGLGQSQYSYDDMKNVYEVIKENYVFENNDVLKKKLTNDNGMQKWVNYDLFLMYYMDIQQ